MDASRFRAVFLALFTLSMAVEWFLIRLNRREALRHPSLPARFAGPEFAGHFDAAGFAKSRAYALERLAFDAFSLVYSAAITCGLLFSGMLPWFDRLLAQAFRSELHRGAWFLAGVFLLQSLLKLPLTVYATFRLEGKYGFNTMTWDLFRRDLVKGMILSAALGLPLLYAVLALLFDQILGQADVADRAACHDECTLVSDASARSTISRVSLESSGFAATRRMASNAALR